MHRDRSEHVFEITCGTLHEMLDCTPDWMALVIQKDMLAVLAGCYDLATVLLNIVRCIVLGLGTFPSQCCFGWLIDDVSHTIHHVDYIRATLKNLFRAVEVQCIWWNANTACQD
jgi:hypothetical protein